ncbi:MAG TPA: hypothetical protein VN667_02495 [Burkholderiales bacterium]|nr:hypothetical protein [Burkholderiales bacterium]
MKKTPIAIALLTCAAGPAGVQVALAQSTQAPSAQANSCMANNYDASRGMFTVTNPGAGPGTVNQQCFITVVSGRPDPASGQLPAGTYEILLSGGGGGGGGGSDREGGGGGGAGAVPQRIERDLAPGTYRITVGRGGLGGKGCQVAVNGGAGRDGAPSSIAEAYTGQTVAGFTGAENWTGAQSYTVASSRATPGQSATTSIPPGAGGPAMIGQSGGGGGGRVASSTDHRAESGTWLADVNYGGKPGSGGYGIAPETSRPLVGGGGGGAGYGNGGDGQSVGRREVVAKAGELGGGGGGGAGGPGVCGDGAAGGDGFVKMTLLKAAS